jgi:Tfp pilus assembly protein PilP
MRRKGSTSPAGQSQTLGFAIALASSFLSMPAYAQDAAEETPSESEVVKKVEPGDDATDGSLDSTVATEETWDSYAEATIINSAAQDVTMGVRVEDIVEPPTDYQFAAFGKGDPFVPPLYLKEDIVSAVDPIEIPIISPLQRHPIASLVVAGIWENAGSERKALILIPDAAGPVGIVSRKDDPIGINGGRILSIQKESVTVREFRLAPDGTRQYDDKQLVLDRTGMPDEPQVGGSILIRPGASQGEVVGGDGKPLALTTGNPGGNVSGGALGLPAQRGPAQGAAAESARLQSPAATDAAIPVVSPGGNQDVNPAESAAVASPAPAAQPAAAPAAPATPAVSQGGIPSIPPPIDASSSKVIR